MYNGKRNKHLSGVGAIYAKTPSGYKVELSDEEEKQAAKEAMKVYVKEDALKKQRMKQEIVSSAIGAIGTAVGFAIAGLIIERKGKG